MVKNINNIKISGVNISDIYPTHPIHLTIIKVMELHLTH